LDRPSAPKSPEERELEKKRADLAALEPVLAERELELATVTAGLRDFERRYLVSVGVKYAELDEVEAQLYEAAASLAPQDSDAQLKAEAGRQQAKASAMETLEAKKEEPRSSAPRQFNPTERLKKLYREVAKAMHPDLADGEEDRARRHEFMIRVNEVYAKGDEEQLHAILLEWEHSPEFVKGDSVAAELVRMIRKIARGEERLEAIATELQKLTHSELYLLKGKVEDAEKSGRDLLSELAGQVATEVQEARQRLAHYQKRLA
jgi:hypothetical protein